MCHGVVVSTEGFKKSVYAGMVSNLESGETVEIVGSALVGQLSVKKNLAQALIVSAATLGTITAWRQPQKLFLALTDRRLVFLTGSVATGKSTSKVALALPRTALSTVGTRSKRVMFVIPTLVVDLAVKGSDQGMRLQFPAAMRAEGAAFASALPPAETA